MGSLRRYLELVACVAFAALLIFSGRVGSWALSDASTRLPSSISQPPDIPTAITTGATARDLALAMGISSGDIVVAEYTLNQDPLALAVGSGKISYFPTQGDTVAILSTGYAGGLEVASPGQNWTTNLDGSTEDKVQLHLKLKVPAGKTCMGFDFAFYSEEFPEWVNSRYNDYFVAEKGTSNIERTNDPVTWNPIITSATNFAFDSQQNTVTVNSAFGISGNTGTFYDGVTPLLRAQTGVTAGQQVDLFFTIGDVGDSYLDSAVILDNFSWGEDANCAEGAKVEGQFLPPDPTQRWTRSIRVDTNQNGRPDPADGTVDVTRDSGKLNYLTFGSRFGKCIVEMGNPDPQSGNFQSLIYRRPQPSTGVPSQATGNGLLQFGPAATDQSVLTVNIDSFDANLRPNSASLVEERTRNGTVTTKTGTLAAEDTNRDGIVDGHVGQGTGIPRTSLSMVYSDINGDGNADFFSLPWAVVQSAAAATKNEVPPFQAWVPLGDTNGDGIPDAPALDLDFDNKPDPGIPLPVIVAGPKNVPQEFNLAFPQFPNGQAGGMAITSEVILANQDSLAAAHAEVTIHDSEGTLYPVKINGQATTGEIAVDIPAGGMRSLKTSGEGTLQVGSVTVKSNRPLAGTTIYWGPAGAAGVGASADFGQGFVAPVRRVISQNISTGIAIMNLGGTPLDVKPELYKANGDYLCKGYSTRIDPYGQIAMMVDEFSWDLWGSEEDQLNDFTGLLKILVSGKAGATVLLTRPGEYATQPVMPCFNTNGSKPLQLASSLATTPTLTQSFHLDFAQFADGAIGIDSIVSSIYLFSQDLLSSADATVIVRDNSGNPLSMVLNGQSVSGQLPVSIPSNGLQVINTSGTGTVKVGSVTVTSDRVVSGNVLYASSAGAAGVGPSVQTAQGFIAPMENNQAAGISAGIGVTNLNAQAVTLNLTLHNMDGVQQANAQLTLSAYGHLAQTLTEFNWSPKLNLSNFKGILKATSGGKKIAATVLQTRPNQYLTLPVGLKLN